MGKADQLPKILYYRLTSLFLFNLIINKIFRFDYFLEFINKLQSTKLSN